MPYSCDRSSSYEPPGHARSTWALLVAALVAVWLLAIWLEPAPAGVGTHLRLGLPPCGFHALTGVPCPACGLTTSFAHLARWQLGGAWQAQPLGVLLGVASWLWLGLCVYGWFRGLPPDAALRRWRADRQLRALLWLALIVWVLRVTASS